MVFGQYKYGIYLDTVLGKLAEAVAIGKTVIIPRDELVRAYGELIKLPISDDEKIRLLWDEMLFSDALENRIEAVRLLPPELVSLSFPGNEKEFEFWRNLEEGILLYRRKEPGVWATVVRIGFSPKVGPIVTLKYVQPPLLTGRSETIDMLTLYENWDVVPAEWKEKAPPPPPPSPLPEALKEEYPPLTEETVRKLQPGDFLSYLPDQNQLVVVHAKEYDPTTGRWYIYGEYYQPEAFKEQAVTIVFPDEAERWSTVIPSAVLPPEKGAELLGRAVKIGLIAGALFTVGIMLYSYFREREQ
ncbi:MAG: hypothetical protein DRJ03_17035 [Chloroflexi bacterium]|nr:MAG: hypothetical protein DRJ03_17035 [Chloroflexota bacterium]